MLSYHDARAMFRSRVMCKRMKRMYTDNHGTYAAPREAMSYTIDDLRAVMDRLGIPRPDPKVLEEQLEKCIDYYMYVKFP